MSFADKLKALRIQNDMTQEYVAKRLNVARSTIAGYETKNRQPSHEKLTALAALFQVSVDYLLDEDELLSLELSNTPSFTHDETELILRYRRLSPRSRTTLREYMHYLEYQDQRRV